MTRLRFIFIIIALVEFSEGFIIHFGRTGPCTKLILAARERRSDDAVTRRRNRRKEVNDPTNENDVVNLKVSNISPQDIRNQDGSSSLEDMFGLGNDQLRELMEQEYLKFYHFQK